MHTILSNIAVYIRLHTRNRGGHKHLRIVELLLASVVVSIILGVKSDFYNTENTIVLLKYELLIQILAGAVVPLGTKF